MKQLYDDLNTKVIVDFCKISDKIPNSLLLNKQLKETIKKYYRFSNRKHQLSEDEKLFLGKGSVKFVIKNFQEGDSIIIVRDGDILIHSFISRDGKFLDIAGNTDNIDDILDDFPNENIDFAILNDIEFFKENFKKFS